MKKLSIDLYKKLFLIRASEEKIKELYPEDQIKTPTHLAIGEEAIAVGVISATSPNSEIFGTYRNHGIYLAKTGETDQFFAELYGKKTGLSKGKAGSMHMMSPEKGFMVTSAIVGSTIPAAVGAAFANRYFKKNKTSIVFFGDGAVDEGAFWESLNFACLKKLPMLFVCENNNYAIHSSASERHGYASISKIAAQFNCISKESFSTDVEEIYSITSQALKEQQRKPQPVFLHFHYYRYLEHVGIQEDFIHGYRPKSEYSKWLKKDPVALQRKRLLNTGVSEKTLLQAEQHINDQIARSVHKAINAPFPALSELLTDVYE